MTTPVRPKLRLRSEETGMPYFELEAPDGYALVKVNTDWLEGSRRMTAHFALVPQGSD